MSSKSKLTVPETGRWIRVGVFSASALLPLMNTALNRMRARQDATVAIARERNAEYKENLVDLTKSVQSEVREDLQTVGATLGEILTELQTRSNNQDLIKRTNRLREDLRDRSSKLSRAIAERSEEVSHELAKRSGEVSHELAKRSEEVSHELAKRSGEVSQVLAKRSRQAQQTVAEQNRTFWIALGFSFGLTAAGIVTFVLIRRRLQRPAATDDAPIQLSYNTATTKLDHGTSEARGGIYPVPASNGHEAVRSGNPERDATTSSAPDSQAVENAAPVDAAFVGVSSTKHYYPVATPLDQLTTASEEQVDIIYFASETEAQAQGFQAAEV